MSAVCRGCGKPIIWGVTPEGKRIPLDPRPPVYVVDYSAEAKEFVARLVPLEDGVRTHMVSHFATCPKASEFSGGRKS
jgi:hypothetical protein